MSRHECLAVPAAKHGQPTTMSLALAQRASRQCRRVLPVCVIHAPLQVASSSSARHFRFQHACSNVFRLPLSTGNNINNTNHNGIPCHGTVSCVTRGRAWSSRSYLRSRGTESAPGRRRYMAARRANQTRVPVALQHAARRQRFFEAKDHDSAVPSAQWNWKPPFPSSLRRPWL